MTRTYTDKGLLSKGSVLMVFDNTLSKYIMLVPTTTLPETKGAPSVQAKTVLTDSSVTEVEGLQTNAQKSYTFNYHRDNINRLNLYKGVEQRFLEVNPDFTGEKFSGTIQYGRGSVAVDGIVQGTIYLTVASAEDAPIGDVRDLVANTAIITTPLEEVSIVGTATKVITLDALPSTATFAVVSSTVAACTVAMGTAGTANQMTITGVAAGTSIITITTSATGEASSKRTLLVTVTAA